jgi:leader peptidase (prepilin peptidase)/N-methyltransferase
MLAEMFADPGLRIGLAAVLGAIVGSFLNVVIYRVPRGMSIVAPRSRCGSCDQPIRPWENVPVLSYLFLRGKCGRCRASISFRYPAVELMTAGLFVGISEWFGIGPALPFLLFFSTSLLAIAWIDFDFRIIPDAMSIGGTVVGLVASFFLPVSPLHALIGALLGGGILWGLALGYRMTTGIDGMGGGDIKLAAMIGAFLGPTGVVFTLFLASLLGTLVGGVLMIVGSAGRRTALPFGTFLAPAAVVALFAAPAFFTWYAGLLAPAP